MAEISIELLKERLKNAAQKVIDNEPCLTEIDMMIGDGDHGTSMKRGFGAALKLLGENEYTYINDMMRDFSIELIRSMGGASGVIFGTMFFGGINELPKSDTVSLKELAKFFDAGEKAIEKRGKSKPGEKTMLDALYPAVCAMNEDKADDPADFFKAAWKEALAGAEKSKSIVSKKGRSSNFGELTIGRPDPGAVSVTFIFEGIYETIAGRSKNIC